MAVSVSLITQQSGAAIADTDQLLMHRCSFTWIMVQGFDFRHVADQQQSDQYLKRLVCWSISKSGI